MTDAIDEFTLLCESCGYPLTGLPTEGKCPECGTPIAESVPERRVGSPWQKRPSYGTWIGTNLLALFQPRLLFERMRIEHRRSRLLLRINLAVASALLVFFPSWFYATASIGHDSSGEGSTVAGIVRFLVFLVLMVVAGTAVWTGLFLLTTIEFVGVQFFGKRSRWRITHAVAYAVCSHASVGWIVAGLLFLMASTLPPLLDAPWWLAYSWPPDLRIALVAAGTLLGLLLFEIRVYIGIRRCRFANRIPPVSPA